MRIAMFEPEIAGNVGAVLRLAACMGAAVDLIEPLGFAWDDRRVRQAYRDRFDAHTARLETLCRRIGAHFITLNTADDALPALRRGLAGASSGSE